MHSRDRATAFLRSALAGQLPTLQRAGVLAVVCRNNSVLRRHFARQMVCKSWGTESGLFCAVPVVITATAFRTCACLPLRVVARCSCACRSSTLGGRVLWEISVSVPRAVISCVRKSGQQRARGGRPTGVEASCYAGWSARRGGHQKPRKRGTVRTQNPTFPLSDF